MSSSKNVNDGGPACGDPYEILGVELGSTDADISKAYRRLALKLHPDKQRQKGLSEADVERVAKEFHDVKEARSFLLDPEHRAERERYDRRLASEKLRKAEDERRERGMSDRRKRLREELLNKERRARKGDDGHPGGAAGHVDEDERVLEALRRQGKKMRERYSDQAASEAALEESRERVSRASALEERQVRLKWSRRKTKTSYSEDSIARLLKRFGDVEQVEILGSKGNAALVTFAKASSCAPCVEAYAQNDTMRATFVGRRKQEEMRRFFQKESEGPVRGGVSDIHREAESLAERKLRQAAERERLLRRMEVEDAGSEKDKHDIDLGGGFPEALRERSDLPRKSAGSTREPSYSAYPPPFPKESDNLGFTPLQKLEAMERIVFKNILSPETLRNMQVLTSE